MLPQTKSAIIAQKIESYYGRNSKGWLHERERIQPRI